MKFQRSGAHKVWRATARADSAPRSAWGVSAGGTVTPPGWSGQVAGERVQQEAKGVGAKRVAGEPIGGEIALELLDEVLGLPPLVVPGEDVRRPAAAVGDDEADVGSLRGVLDHREHAPRAAPAPGLIAQARKPPHRVAGALVGDLGVEAVERDRKSVV